MSGANANDAIIKDRLNATAQILNIGGGPEFAESIADQRAKLAAAAKELGIKAKQ